MKSKISKQIDVYRVFELKSKDSTKQHTGAPVEEQRLYKARYRVYQLKSKDFTQQEIGCAK